MRTARLGIVLMCAATAWAEAPFHDMTFDAACEAAKKDGKLVMVDFFTTWCGPCKQLDRTTWKDEKVRTWLAGKTVALKIDAEKERALAKKYKVSAYPTILFIKADGTEIDRIVGYRDADAFLEEAGGALSGKDAVARAREKLKDGHENDPMLRMRVARALEEKGKLDEALAEYLWCFDHGNEHNAGFGGVRVSFLLGDISRLAKSHPPAKEALRTRRDAAEKTLMTGKSAASRPKGGLAVLLGGGRDERLEAASVFAAINREFGESSRTLGVYDKLGRKKGSEAVCKLLFRHVFDDLLKARRYDDIYADCGDPMRMVDTYVDGAKGKGVFGSRDKQLRDYYKRQVVSEGGKYYEVLLGAGQPNKAAEVADKVLGVNASSSAYARLVAHSRRAAHPEAADQLIERARKSDKFDADELAGIQGAKADETGSGSRDDE